MPNRAARIPFVYCGEDALAARPGENATRRAFDVKSFVFAADAALSSPTKWARLDLEVEDRKFSQENGSIRFREKERNALWLHVCCLGHLSVAQRDALHRQTAKPAVQLQAPGSATIRSLPTQGKLPESAGVRPIEPLYCTPCLAARGESRLSAETSAEPAG